MLTDAKSVMMGIDLSDDYTQLCCLNRTGEPVSVSLNEDQTKFRIPTVLCACADKKEWFFGETALTFEENLNCIRINDLLNIAEENRSVMLFDRSYPADIILERFLNLLFTEYKRRNPGNRVDFVVITVKNAGENLIHNIESAMELIGISKDRLKIITHIEAFMYYVVSQNKDIWINDVGLFDFERERFSYYKLSFGRKQNPVTIVAEKTDLTENINYEMLNPGNSGIILYAFENVTSMMVHKQLISTLYFTGPGFESAWADDTLKGLCTGRRVFRGQNLFVKGSGYAAAIFASATQDNYLLISNDILKSSISLRVFKDSEYTELPLVSIGQKYYEATADINVIMDDTNELDFVIQNLLKKDSLCAIMTLDTLNVRQDRTVRLNIKLRFAERDVCIITVRDTGFGEFYENNHRIWEQVLKV